uniref:Uncharacterized protein n=1 Tax=Chrysemys picta bellii TaxID=8478 RepID=A0A8C3ILG0_CHRPI
MERETMKTLFIFALVMSVWSCSGLPVYDYEPSIMEEALRASIGRVNSRSQWPALFGIVRSYVRGVSVELVKRMSLTCLWLGKTRKCQPIFFWFGITGHRILVAVIPVPNRERIEPLYSYSRFPCLYIPRITSTLWAMLSLWKFKFMVDTMMSKSALHPRVVPHVAGLLTG